jgi:oligopeptidase B
MKNQYFCVVFMMTTLVNQSFAQKMKEQTTPPVAKKVAHPLTAHGQTRNDEYYWMRDRENQEVIDYLNAENKYTQKQLAPIKKNIANLFKEMKSRIKQDDQSVPYFHNEYWYYSKFEKGKEYPIFCRKKTSFETGKEEITLNVNKIAKGKPYCQVGGLDISDDNQLGVYAADFEGRRFYTLYFIDLKTNQLLADVIPQTTGNVTWAADNKTVFYSKQDEQTLRSDKIYKHKLGTDPKDDELVFEEKDEIFTCYVTRTKSEKYLIIHSSATLSDEVLFLDAKTPDGAFKSFLPREKAHEYSIEHSGEHFYIRTNLQAKNFKIMRCKADKSQDKSTWEEVVGHSEETYIEGMESFKNYLVIEQRTGGLTEINLMKWSDKSFYKINFGEETYTASIGMNPEYNTDLLRFGYSSLTTPGSTFEYNMSTKAKKLLKQQPVLDPNFKPENYKSERHWAIAKDGTKVPISLVYKKGLKKDGQNPTLQYAYGSYGASMDPYFSSIRLSLLDRGFVFAIAHIRGGQELGRDWYENGKFLKKKNTFTDFIDCSEYLIQQKFTSPEKLVAMGGSAGGLLMGAVNNMRPDLYKAIVAQVPFVDVVTTMLDETIPLTTGEYDEWGNPNDKTYYDYMLSYSPYDNVEKKNYPNMLVTTGLHDSQVQYWEPAKWVAKLRDMKTDKNTLLLHTNMKAGHGGASGRFESIKEIALEYGWLMGVLGVRF